MKRQNSYSGKSLIRKNYNNDSNKKLDRNLNNSSNSSINFTLDCQKIKGITNVTTLQNYIISLINELNQRDDKINKLSKENTSLITRMRNINLHK